MKILLASLFVLLVMAGAASFVLLNQVEDARAYVSEAVPDSLEEQVRTSVEGATNAVRNLTNPSDVSTVDPVNDAGGTGVPEPAWEIGASNGTSVTFRSECRERSLVDGSFDAGEPVSVIARGVGACVGWTLVASEKTHETSWVADSHLVVRASDPPPDGTPTLVAAPSSPTATATTEPAPSASASPGIEPTTTPRATATSTATAAPSVATVAVWFGQLDGSAGDIVSARIGGVMCEATTAYANDGAALYYLPIANDAPCDPSPGDAVEFRINDKKASTSGVWQPGSSTELALP
jgi:cell division septation protein DedD